MLLLDEPFAALDPQSREGLIEDLTRTLHETGTTTVFVTHDRVEAQRLADRIAVLERGRVRQVGGAEEVLRRPADAFVAGFVGIENLLPVSLSAAHPGGGFTAVLTGAAEPAEGTGAARASLEIGAAKDGMAAGSAGLLCVRPEDDMVTAAGADTAGDAVNRLRGRVTAVVSQGPFLKVSIDCGVQFVAAISGHLARQQALVTGQQVTVVLRPADLYAIPKG